MFRGTPSAIKLGNQVAYGSANSMHFKTILSGNTFGAGGQRIEPLYIAYAFYVIAEYVGDREAKKRQYWLARYIPPVIRKQITTTISTKYSEGYLRTCFSRSDTAKHQQAQLMETYPLYMD